MLEIHIEKNEYFNPVTNEFIEIKPITVKLEHSLISISKWESIWEVPYLPVKGKVKGMTTRLEQISYIDCMIIGKVPDYIPTVLYENYSTVIMNYIEKPHSATTINRRGPQRPSREIVTSEVIYYWMAKYNIPIECERWHFNRLIKLLEVYTIKETPAKSNRVSRSEAVNEMYRLNAQRRAALNG